MIKAIFLDFYGTVVYEDDEIIPIICSKIKNSTKVECTWEEISTYWWKLFSSICAKSYLNDFKTQKEIGLTSLRDTIIYYKSAVEAEEIIQLQFDYWKQPPIFEDSISFFKRVELPVYILSNIDTNDITEAIKHWGIQVEGVITSEDVTSYKPRPEMFNEAVYRYNLKSAEVIHVGDSLVSDISGAQGAGIKAVWINRKRKERKYNIHPEYEISRLDDLLKIILKV